MTAATRRPTIRDVAKLAGVSTATVSYVLNDTGSVSEPTAVRVRAAVDELGYRANSLAVAHRTGRSGAIGLAVPDLTNPHFPEVAAGVHHAAASHGLSVLLIDAHKSVETEAEGLERLIARMPEGLIWSALSDDVIRGRELPFPIVAYDSEIKGVDNVRADIRRGGELQAELLLRYGHERIGILSGPEWSETAMSRRQGLVERLGTDATIEWDFAIDPGPHIPDNVARAVLSSTVTCAVAGNDMQAIGLLKLYRDAGMHVPGDVSVIGFDDIAFAELVGPPLTTVRLPTRDLGEKAVELLTSRIKDPDQPPREVEMPVTVVERDSLGPAPK